MNHEATLRAHLTETLAQVEDRCQSEWLRLAGSDQPAIILFGAGNLGRRIARAMAGAGWNLLGFSDNDPLKWGSQVEGLPVYSPQEAIRLAGPSGCFIVTIWQGLGSHRFKQTRQQLLGLGAGHVAHAGHLGWREPDRILPYYSLDHPRRMLGSKEAILQALERWDDPGSRALFVRLALWRLTLDFDLLPEPDPREEYFAETLMPPRFGEVFVDGGAFDGDSTERFLTLWGDQAAQVYAFEPDPANSRAFRKRFLCHPDEAKIQLHSLALAAHEGELAFVAEGTFGSAASPAGTVRVPAASLDVLFAGQPFSLLKLDVEGSEMDALRGGRTVIRAYTPRMAVCVYHTQAHLWEIPNLVGQLAPDSRFSLVNHGIEGWDVVMYSVPR